MPVQSLPSNPSFENLRKQAKSLLKAVHNGEPNALARVREFHPKSDEAFINFTLSAAQLVTARSYAFPSWSRLKQHLEVLDQHSLLPGHRHVSEVAAQEHSDTPEPIGDRFIRLACLNYLDDHTRWLEKARELVAADPSIGRENIYTAATAGDVAVVTRLLKSNRKLAKTRGGPYKWEPLLYAAYSRLNRNAPEYSTLEVARLLIAHGADPNAGFLWDSHYVFTALTGAFGEGESGPVNQPEHQYCYQLARMLLEAGADPNDSQTLYNRMFTGGTRHLELLFEFGLGKKTRGVDAWFKRLGGQDEGPGEMLQQQMGWAAKYNQMERMRLLIEHGVDVNIADTRLRRKPYELALLNGNFEMAQYLLAQGAKQTQLSEVDAFAAACQSADEVRARSLLGKNPRLIDQLGDERCELLNRAAESDKRDAIRLMVQLGFDLNEIRRTAPLHLAAAGSNLEMVKLLIELGADPLLRDTEFNATPLGWADYNHRTENALFLRQFEKE